GRGAQNGAENEDENFRVHAGQTIAPVRPGVKTPCPTQLDMSPLSQIEMSPYPVSTTGGWHGRGGGDEPTRAGQGADRRESGRRASDAGQCGGDAEAERAAGQTAVREVPRRRSARPGAPAARTIVEPPDRSVAPGNGAQRPAQPAVGRVRTDVHARQAQGTVRRDARHRDAAPIDDPGRSLAAVGPAPEAPQLARAARVRRNARA